MIVDLEEKFLKRCFYKIDLIRDIGNRVIKLSNRSLSSGDDKALLYKSKSLLKAEKSFVYELYKFKYNKEVLEMKKDFRNEEDISTNRIKERNP